MDGFENSQLCHSSLDRHLVSGLGNFHFKNDLRKKNFVVYFRSSIRKKFLTVDSYNMNGNQVWLAVMLWLSGVVVDRDLSREAWTCARKLIVDHRRVNVYSRVKFLWLVSTACLHSA